MPALDLPPGSSLTQSLHSTLDLIERGLWTNEVRNQMMADGGSVQKIGMIPEDLKELYKTVWEIKQRTCLDMAADRGAYICQSQSLNVHMAEPTMGKLTSMHFYAWRKGLKTGMYYLRTRPKADAIQFTVDQTMVAQSRKQQEAQKAAEDPKKAPASPIKPKPQSNRVGDDDGECLSCGA